MNPQPIISRARESLNGFFVLESGVYAVTDSQLIAYGTEKPKGLQEIERADYVEKVNGVSPEKYGASCKASLYFDREILRAALESLDDEKSEVMVEIFASEKDDGGCICMSQSNSSVLAMSLSFGASYNKLRPFIKAGEAVKAEAQ